MRNGKNINPSTVMIAPNDSHLFTLTSAVSKGETLTLHNINDYGTEIPVKLIVK